MPPTKLHEDPKRAIVLGAFAALKAQGLPMMSYDIIADNAGLSRQLVRYHFSDPGDLMVAVCDYLAECYRDALLAAVTKADTVDRLEVFLDFYFDLLDEAPKPRDDQVYDAMMSLAAGSERVQDNLRTQYGLLGQVLSHEFSLKHPDLDSESANELAYLFVCLMYGHWKMVASLEFDEEHKHITRKAMDRLIRSYVANPGPSAETVSVWKTNTGK